MSHSLLRQLPSVSQLLESQTGQALMTKFGQSLTTEAVRQVINQLREQILKSENGTRPDVSPEATLDKITAFLHQTTSPTLFPVINATGVVIHTNLGRATLSPAAQQAVQKAAAGYSNLEFDVPTGKRGSRSLHAQSLLQQVTGAQAAHVVNNTASAVLLMLSALCQGREVIISRGQLVEIGGGFRVPDVMKQSGVKLVEVGTTNRTHLRDYEQAINENTAAILVAHHSNFKIVGFTTEPSLQELSRLAHQHDIPLLYDQGSGCLIDTTPFGLEAEPTVQAGVLAGCDLLAFSGDKLLGGPQAGIMVGRSDLVEACRKHPLARAVRPDKLCLAALSATLLHFLKEEALREIPVWRMISMPLETVETRAQNWLSQCQTASFSASIIDGVSTVGGGTLPGTTIPTRLLALNTERVDDFATQLRLHPARVISRIQDDQILLDPRTVLPEQDQHLIKALLQVDNPA
ncbi:MAG: L-seryl-tRNA(Sec) selenium transferase [Ardenticatenaceae bacterium]|nr:L-seryl-tRNA(Sec) selenium transferase [Ardenticatenaceae bacterium]